MLTGARPGEEISFVDYPQHSTGFGGGIMGVDDADGQGVIQFTYPPFTQKDEIGQWVVTAGQRGSGIIASTIITIVAP